MLQGLKLRHYFDPRTLRKDIPAGVTLGIESIPDAMASGILAMVNPIHALYAVMVSTTIGTVCASSVFMSVQTTSAMSLIVADVRPVHSGPDAVGSLFMLAILTGVFMIVSGVLKLGSLLRFVPNAVMVGFINGVAVLIILGQLDNFTGYESSGDTKVEKLLNLMFNLQRIDLATLTVGLFTIALIVVLNKTRLRDLSFVVALGIASLLVPLLAWKGVAVVADIAEIPDKWPLPMLPPLNTLLDLLVPALSLAFVGLVQGAGISQNYRNPDGKYPSASGDFIGQGAANVAAGLFQGMPVGGSLSATALVHSAGARTRFANVFAGITIGVALLLLGDVIAAIAMPALAALLIVIGFHTLKPGEMRQVWHTGPIQKVAMGLTFVTTLIIPLQYAVLLGVGVSVVLYVVRQSNVVTMKRWVFGAGMFAEERSVPAVLPGRDVTVLVPYGSLFFAAAPIVEEQLPAVTKASRHGVVIISLNRRPDLGSTFLEVLERYAGQLRAQHGRLMLAEVSENVVTQLERTGYMRAIGRENVFVKTRRVPESLLDALDEARKWIEETTKNLE